MRLNNTWSRRLFLAWLLLSVSVLPAQQRHHKPSPGLDRVNWGNPINDGLVLWLPLNEGAGSRTNDIAGGNDGVLTNMDPATDWVGSLHGGALDFDGSDDNVEIDGTPALSGDITISAWVNPGSTTQNAYISDFSSGNEFALLGGFQDGFWNAFGGSYPCGGVAANSQIPMSGVGIWDHVVWTLRGTILKGYVNGVEESSCTQDSGDFSPGATLGLGNSGFGTNNFDGRIDDYKLYERALTALEVRQLYHFPFGGILRTVERLTRWFVEPSVPSGNPALINFPLTF